MQFPPNFSSLWDDDGAKIMHTSKPWYKPKWLKNSIFNEKSHENKRDFNPSNVLMMTQQKSLKVLMMNFVYMRRDREKNF